MMAPALPPSIPGAVVIVWTLAVLEVSLNIENQVRNAAICIAGDIHYHVDCWGNPTMGYRFYEPALGVNVVRASNEVFYEKLVVRKYLAKLQHGWLSATGMAEANNAIVC